MLYKTTVIINPKLIDQEISQLKDKLVGLIQEKGGEIKDIKNSQRKKLAYSIDHQDYGVYLSWYFEADRGKIDSINQSLKNEKEILRFLTVLLPVRSWSDFETKIKKARLTRVKNIKTTQKEDSSKKTTKKKVSLQELDKKLDEILESDK